MLEDLGNLGDFLGGIGVVVTLIYLAFQIRDNTRGLDQNANLMKMSFENEIRHDMIEFRLAIAADNELSEIWSRGLEGLPELSQADRARFDLLMTNVIAMMNAQFEAHSRGLYERGQAPFFRMLAGSPGFREWWDRRRAQVQEQDSKVGERPNPEFARYIEGLVRPISTDAGKE